MEGKKFFVKPMPFVSQADRTALIAWMSCITSSNWTYRLLDCDKSSSWFQSLCKGLSFTLLVVIYLFYLQDNVVFFLQYTHSIHTLIYELYKTSKIHQPHINCEVSVYQYHVSTVYWTPWSTGKLSFPYCMYILTTVLRVF